MFGLPAAHKGAVIYGAWRCGAAPPDTSQRAASVGLPGPKLPSFPKSRTETYSLKNTVQLSRKASRNVLRPLDANFPTLSFWPRNVQRETQRENSCQKRRRSAGIPIHGARPRFPAENVCSPFKKNGGLSRDDCGKSDKIASLCHKRPP